MTQSPHGKLVTAAAYAAHYDPLSGFESICSLARQTRNLDFLTTHQPARILKIGSGSMILARMPGVENLTFAHWTIIEPLTDFVAAARTATADDPRFAVVQGYLEGEVATLRAMPGFGAGYDAVVLSGLLHETSDPTALLAAAVALTAPGGHVLASVPNAGSFHRLLAVEAGLIDRPDRLSPRDVTLGHPVVFDRAGFQALMQASGLTDLTFDGYLFKPFTHAQMEAVLALPGPDLVEGLIRLGRLFPDQAAEICVTGRKPAV